MEGKKCAELSLERIAGALDYLKRGRFVPILHSVYCSTAKVGGNMCDACREAIVKVHPDFEKLLMHTWRDSPRAFGNAAIFNCGNCMSVRLAQKGKRGGSNYCPLCAPLPHCGGCGRPTVADFISAFDAPSNYNQMEFAQSFNCASCHPMCRLCGLAHRRDGECQLEPMMANLRERRGLTSSGDVLKQEYAFSLTRHPKAGGPRPSRVTKANLVAAGIPPREVLFHEDIRREVDHQWLDGVRATLRGYLGAIAAPDRGFVLAVSPANFTAEADGLNDRVGWITVTLSNLFGRRGMPQPDRFVAHVNTAINSVSRNRGNKWVVIHPPFTPTTRIPFCHLAVEPFASQSWRDTLDFLTRTIMAPRNLRPGPEEGAQLIERREADAGTWTIPPDIDEVQRILGEDPRRIRGGTVRFTAGDAPPPEFVVVEEDDEEEGGG